MSCVVACNEDDLEKISKEDESSSLRRTTQSTPISLYTIENVARMKESLQAAFLLPTAYIFHSPGQALNAKSTRRNAHHRLVQRCSRITDFTANPSRLTLVSQYDSHAETNFSDPSPTRDVYFATCARGLGEYLAREIESDNVQGEVLDIASSGVRFLATEPGHVTGYRACLWLRTAMRVLLEVSTRQLPSPSNTSHASFDLADSIYDFVKDCADWPTLLEDGAKSFSVQTRVSEGSARRHSYHRTQSTGPGRRTYSNRLSVFTPGEHAVQVRVKDAICDALRDVGLPKPNRPSSHSEADVPLFVTLHDARVTVYRDMAGASLHKRGYRADSALHRSSLNESVAAGMLYVAGFAPDGSFRGEGERDGQRTKGKELVIVDPMCGSGTLLIEAALLRLHVAVGLYRERFAFEQWVDFDERVYRSIVDDTITAQHNDDEMDATLIGNDADVSALVLAKRGLDRTRLTRLVKLRHGDVRDLALKKAATLTICNPPWGVRIDREVDAWEGLGGFLREFGSGGTAVLLCGEKSVSRGLKMRTKRKVPVRVGNVDCRVLVYNILPKLEKGIDGRSLNASREGSEWKAESRMKLEETEKPVF